MFMTLNEVAEKLRLNKKTIYRWIAAGKLPAVKIGRDYRIKEEDVESLIDNSVKYGKDLQK